MVENMEPLQSQEIIDELRKHYSDNPPDDTRIEKIKLLATALQYLEDVEKAFPKVITPVDTVLGLDGKTRVIKEYVETTGGIISIFEKATIYGYPRDAINYWLNRKGRRKAFGDFMGWIYGEIPAGSPTGRQLFEFTVDEPHIEARKALRRSLKQKKIRRDYYAKYLKGNTLKDFASGRSTYQIWKKLNPEEAAAKNLAKRKKRDKKREEKESGSYDPIFSSANY